MIEIRDLTKRFGSVTAVHGLTFTVEPGAVTGFLGPNGAGKTTTLRMALGLVRPTSGWATINGTRYADLPHPTRTVGAVLDSARPHPACTARDHLRIYAAMGGHSRRRVDEVIEALDMTAFAGRRAGDFSTGMRQRLSLATALLGDPQVLLLDEPGNGLDPSGTAWLRDLLRTFAAEGRTILVSSHVLSEVEQLADHVVVIREGRLVTAGPVRELSGVPAVLVRSPDTDRLAGVLAGHATPAGPGLLRVSGLTPAEIADRAAGAGLRVHELTPERRSLEHVFLSLTGEGTTR